MTSAGSASHWDAAYSHGDTTRSWYQAKASPSLAMLDRCGVTPADNLIDVGGGASTLIDALLAHDYRDLTVVDISAEGERIARERLGSNADAIAWVVSDVLTWQPERAYRVWHDRALFHFLTTPAARSTYLATMNAATERGSLAILATFAPDGPETCSGLSVARYDVDGLGTELGTDWQLVVEDRQEHITPAGVVQPFVWAAFRRR